MSPKLEKFYIHLIREEKSRATIEKYLRDAAAFLDYAAGQELTKELTLATRGSRTNRLWKYRCDCGEITYKATDTLTNPDKSMCRTCAGKYAAQKARENAGYREGTQVSRIKNLTKESQNRTGVRGVYLDGKTGKYRARIKFQGKTHNLGTFTTLEDAVKERLRAEEEYFGAFLEKSK